MGKILAAEQELAGGSVRRYLDAVSPGLEEDVKAQLFAALDATEGALGKELNMSDKEGMKALAGNIGDLGGAAARVKKEAAAAEEVEAATFLGKVSSGVMDDLEKAKAKHGLQGVSTNLKNLQ